LSLAVGLTMAGLVGPAARGDGKPNEPPPRVYELRVVAVGDTYKGIRFKRADRGVVAACGRPLGEVSGGFAPPPAGDYEVHLIAADSLLAIRLNRTTGATWLIRRGKWTPIKEPPLKPGAGAPRPWPRVRPPAHPGGRPAARRSIPPATGETWHVNGNAFEMLGETGPVPGGEFDLTLIAGKKDWMGFRLDRKTGKTWLLAGEKVGPGQRAGVTGAQSGSGRTSSGMPQARC